MPSGLAELEQHISSTLSIHLQAHGQATAKHAVSKAEYKYILLVYEYVMLWHINSFFHCNVLACILNFFTEYAENGSIYDYIHKKHEQPSQRQNLQWAKEVAEGTK